MVSPKPLLERNLPWTQVPTHPRPLRHAVVAWRLCYRRVWARSASPTGGQPAGPHVAVAGWRAGRVRVAPSLCGARAPSRGAAPGGRQDRGGWTVIRRVPDTISWETASPPASPPHRPPRGQNQPHAPRPPCLHARSTSIPLPPASPHTASITDLPTPAPHAVPRRPRQPHRLTDTTAPRAVASTTPPAPAQSPQTTPHTPAPSPRSRQLVQCRCRKNVAAALPPTTSTPTTLPTASPTTSTPLTPRVELITSIPPPLLPASPQTTSCTAPTPQPQHGANHIAGHRCR